MNEHPLFNLFWFKFPFQLLQKALKDPEQSKFLVAEKIRQFEHFGGVRIEDDVLITKDGVENFAIVPRT